MPDRNYHEEMQREITNALPDGDFVVAEVATKLMDDLTARDPDLLNGWLHACAESLISETIGERLRRERASARRKVSPRAVFGDASRKFEETKDPGVFDHFRTSLVIDDKNTRRHIGDMTGTDHKFVSERYASTSKRDALLAQFHNVIAKKVGNKKTSEVMTEAEYDDAYRRLMDEAA